MRFVVGQRAGVHGLVVIVTDTGILGKLFEDGRVQLDLRSAFYTGEEMDEVKTKAIIQRARVVHFTGKRAVALGREMELIDEKRILVVQNVPHAEVVME